MSSIDKVSSIYLNLIKNPHAPKVYRELRDYYLSKGMKEEAKAFANLLYNKYKEISPILDEDNNTTVNER